ncbi:MAG: hypothetical protein BGO01_16900 [Armatimonadetes bacterium 55-13]|jgi:hypothetical protein|nr:MAG: hypothetical protein BGO01_16900 [Armatimonadetes bacterium 55-13]
MSEVNLNQLPAGAKEPERFDLSKHVHEEKPFITGFKMLISVALTTATLAVFLLGGTYLIAGGQVPEFAKKEELPKPPGEDRKLTVAQQKTLQEEVDQVFANYRSEWSAGTVPTSAFASDAIVIDSVGKSSAYTTAFTAGESRLRDLKSVELSQVTDNEVSVTVDELTRYPTNMRSWFLNSGGSPQSGDLVVDRITRYEYRLVKSGDWKIKSRKWLNETAALIQQAGEDALSIPLQEGTVAFEDKRPSKEKLDPQYQAIANEITQGTLTYVTAPSGYEVEFDGGGSIARDELIGRAANFKANTKGLTVKYTIESVDQTGNNSAEATVRYEAQFVPADSTVGNTYVAVWRDRDTWSRSSDISDYWSRTKTHRILRSPILQHYEARGATTPPPSVTDSTTSPTATSSDTSSLPHED